MGLEKQVCSLELAKELKKLGCKQDSLWYWVSRGIEKDDWDLAINSRGLSVKNKNNNYAERMIEGGIIEIKDKCPAYTVAELLELLNEDITIPREIMPANYLAINLCEKLKK